MGADEITLPGVEEASMKHHPYMTASLTRALSFETTADGQFGWGGTPLKRYRGGPKVSSDGTETHHRG